MFFVIALASLLIYAPVAVWVLRRGGVPMLWFCFVIGLGAVVIFSMFLSRIYTVSQPVRLVLFISGLGASSLLATTALLHLSHRYSASHAGQALVAAGGGIVGFLIGMVLAVYGLRSW